MSFPHKRRTLNLEHDKGPRDSPVLLGRSSSDATVIASRQDSTPYAEIDDGSRMAGFLVPPWLVPEVLDTDCVVGISIMLGFFIAISTFVVFKAVAQGYICLAYSSLIAAG